jgi:excisionase family DNA binding protein
LTEPPGYCKIIPEQMFEYIKNGVNVEMGQIDDRLVTTKEACKVLGICAKTLRRWSKDGFISYYETVGGHGRYSLKELKAFLEKNFNKATT